MVSRATGALLLLTVWTGAVASAQDARYINQLRKDAKKGDVAAQYKLGLAYADAYRVKRDYGQAVEWLEQAGRQGHPMAQVYLGKMFYTGVNAGKDLDKAADWLEMAAETGDPEAQALTGNLYNNGEGRPRDFAKAAFWYRAAAEQGDAKAQYNLGALYHNGEGVEQDVVRAFQWISLAAVKPPVEYPKEYGWARDDLEKTLEPEELRQARALIGQWRSKSWDQIREEQGVAVAAEGVR
jgi:hypothetical protein